MIILFLVVSVIIIGSLEEKYIKPNGLYKAVNGANTYVSIYNDNNTIMINGSSPMGKLDLMDTYYYDESTHVYTLNNNSISFTYDAENNKITLKSTRRSDININGVYDK